jgi:hypothetical protein
MSTRVKALEDAEAAEAAEAAGEAVGEAAGDVSGEDDGKVGGEEEEGEGEGVVVDDALSRTWEGKYGEGHRLGGSGDGDGSEGGVEGVVSSLGGLSLGD